MKRILSLLLLLRALPGHAQYCEPADPGGRFLKRDATGFYFASRDDSGYVVHYANDSTYYTKTSPDGIPVAEGGLIGSGKYWRGKQGRWSTNYATGYPKENTNFCTGHEVGEHTDYFPNGVVQRRYNLSWIDWAQLPVLGTSVSFKSGRYQEFHQNSQVMEEGYYKLVKDSCATFTYELPGKDGKMMQQSEVVGMKSVPCGIWWYYNADGSLKRFKVHH
jgi:antitoxin component YwqK of YwqJK toxin-antitoxin module